MRSEEMEKTVLWGIALILALAISYGNAEIIPSEAIETVLEKVANESLTETTGAIEQPSTTEDVTGGVSQDAERRMSLADFFFGNKNNNNNNQDRTEAQTPTIIPGQQQVQVKQNPNQLMFVRETTFPNPNGGLLSRLILARRMSRLQRLSNRLQILPSMFGLFQRQQVQQRTLNQRIGGQYQPEYNPADILLDGVGFKNASVGPHRQYSQARFNQNFANDGSVAQNQGQGRFADNNFYGINDVPNQPYPQTPTSLDQFHRIHANFGLRQNSEQQARQKENIYNAQQQKLLQQQQQKQQAALDQNSQDKSYEQQPQLNQQQQQHYDQQQQQFKYQQQLQEHQEQLRQQQQQLYEQHLNHLRQQQLYDQQQQQLKQQLEEYEKEQQQMHQKQATAENYEQKTSQAAPNDRQQIKLQQELFEQQNQLKQLLLDQQQQLKQQDERFQQLQKHLVEDQKESGNQKPNTQQARENLYYNEAAGNIGHSGNAGVLDFGRPGTYDVGVEINANPFKGQVGGGHTYGSGGTVDGNIGVIDKTSNEQPIGIGYKPNQSFSTGWRLPLFPLGIFPRPLLNLNGKVFFGAELGKAGGVTTGGWK